MAPWHNWQLSQSLPIDSIAAQIIIMGAIIDTLEKKQRLKCHHHYCHYGWHESWRRRQLCTLVWLVKISDFRLMRKMTPKAQQFDMYQWSITQKIPEIICQFTVFENHRKSLIQHCERSELRLHFEWTKVN